MSKSTLFQYSTITSLIVGNYDGVFKYSDLITDSNADFGLGTFHALDGEMLMLDKKVYQLTSNGGVKEVDPSETSTPFATLCEFKPDNSWEHNEIISKSGLEAMLLEKIDSRNIFASFLIKGSFAKILTRTVSKQEKPYPPLAEATKEQGTHQMNDMSGTLVGFYTPKTANTIGVHPFHFHFINDDCNSGGHVFDFVANNLHIEIQNLYDVKMQLPSDNRFLTTNQDIKSLEEQIEIAEKAKE